jgi:hypothetical protein
MKKITVMKKITLVMLLGVFMLGACTDDMTDAMLSVAEDETQNVEVSKNDRLYAVRKIKRSSEAQRAVAVTAKLWENGDTIKIKFLNGGVPIRNKVIAYGAEWMEYANIHFKYLEYGSNENADVKIGFDYDPYPYVSWVTVGTDCKAIPQDEPSINLVYVVDWEGNVFTDPADDEIVRAEILRAYGAMLGLGFEHQSPDAPNILINANTTQNQNKLVNYFGAPILNIIDEILVTYTQAQTKYTAYDETSIMVLPVSRAIVTSPIYTTLGNFELSATDKCFIAALYPKIFQAELVCYALGGAGDVLYIDAYDNLYFFQDAVGTGKQLVKMTPNGVITNLFIVPSTYLNLKTKLAVDNAGYIYLSNSVNMWQFDATGTLLHTFNRQLSSNLFASFGCAIGVLDNNDLFCVVGLSSISNPGSSGYSSIEGFLYNAGVPTSIIENLPMAPPLPFNDYLGAAVSNNNLLYVRYGGGNDLMQLNTNAGTHSVLTPDFSIDDILNLAIAPNGAPKIVGVSASRDIDDVTFFRRGVYEVSPGCGRFIHFLYTYNPNCDSSCEVRNLGALPANTLLPEIVFDFAATTRDGKITYVLAAYSLYKVTKHR